MGFLERADESAFVWLNDWVGRFPLFDRIVELTVSDYFVPLTMSLLLLGLWFAGHSNAHREPNQLGVMTAILSVAVVNLIVELLNDFFYRPRPFEDLDVNLLFYMPTDSSFPANPAAFGFALALGVLIWNKRVGLVFIGTGCGIQPIQVVRRCFLSAGRDWRSSRWSSLCPTVWLAYAYLQAHTVAGTAISQGGVPRLAAEGELVERFGVLQARLFSQPLSPLHNKPGGLRIGVAAWSIHKLACGCCSIACLFCSTVWLMSTYSLGVDELQRSAVPTLCG